MKVTEAKFTRRYNVAQYEHEEYTVGAVVEDGDDVIEVLTQLKADVEAAHAGEAPVTEDKPAKSKKKKSTTVESNEDETGDDDTETDDSETDSDSDIPEDETDEDNTETDDSEGTEEEEEPPKTTKGKKAAAPKDKKKFKKKPQAYQRANEAHKELFSGVLKAVAPNWKAKETTKVLAKKVSQKMEGTDFLDEDGKVFPSFKELVRKHMSVKK